jgi:hypothetical protein
MNGILTQNNIAFFTMKSYTLRIAIFLLISFGCQDSKKVHDGLIVFNLKNYNINTESIHLSKLGIESIQYISLQTDTNIIISNIFNIKFSDSSFFILDLKGRIFQFDNYGHFINQIGTIGKGPGEYIYPSDFDIDKSNKQVFVIPMVREKPTIIIYSFEGEFLKTIRCPDFTKKICYSNDQILCWSDNWVGKVKNINNMFLVNIEGETTKCFPDKYKYNNFKYPNGFIREFFSYNFNKSVYIKELYSDTIFVLHDKKLEPKIIIDHGGKTISASVRGGINNHDDFIEVNKNYSKEINLFQFGNYIYSEFIINDIMYGFIGSFLRKDNFYFDVNTGIINDIDGGPNIRLRAIKNDNTLITWFDAYKLKAHVASEDFKNSIPKFQEKKKELEKLAASLNENDNPVLMLVKLRE